MRTIATAIALIAVMSTGTSWAQESDPANEIAEQWQAEQAERVERQAWLDELMNTMADEMQAIRNAGNRDEREALMATHREHMREAMVLMRSMGGPHLREVMAEHLGDGMDPETDSDVPRHQHKRWVPSRPRNEMSDAQRLTDLENRVDMMQIMIESIVEAEATR